MFYSELFPFALVTGGTDRQIRIWNSRKMSLTPIAIQGYNSPLYDVKISSLNGQIISLSEDKVIRIFDLRSQQALQTIMDPIEQRPEDITS
jgi:WD40 repeat protein